MNRFRKKSDAKQARSSTPPTSLYPAYPQDLSASPDSQLNNAQLSSSTSQLTLSLFPDALPELPPTNDFRTSLILPDLSRRFSLLRSSTGDAVSFDHLRTRLADQRARGAQNQITEEEEDMLLETLGRIRARNSPSPAVSQGKDAGSSGNLGEGLSGTGGAEGSSRSSVVSSNVSSSPGQRSTKRYSNNLFGSGRLRDYTYFNKGGGSSKSSNPPRALPILPPEPSKEEESGGRPITPENNIGKNSSQNIDAVNDLVAVVAAAPPSSSPSSDNTIQTISAAELRLQKTLGPSVFKRASLALEQAIKEIEDEVEEEILLPRTLPVPRANLDASLPEARYSQASDNSSFFEAGIAISMDKPVPEFNERRASPIPARAVSGYVPGMVRPMTPRDLDLDEQRSHSTTPRAQAQPPPFIDPPLPRPASPTNFSFASSSSSALRPLRRESLTSSTSARPSTISPVSVAPLFLARSTNGRQTPDDGLRSGEPTELDLLNPSLGGRRRPVSPLSGPAFQPLAVNRPSSRPTTPSNITWMVNPNHSAQHRRNNSGSMPDGGSSPPNSAGINSNFNLSGDVFAAYDRQMKPAGARERVLRSPHSVPLPNSPPNSDFTVGQNTKLQSLTSVGNGANPGSISQSGLDVFAQYRQYQQQVPPRAYISELEQAMSVHAPRSMTPTQGNGQRSPISPTFPSFDYSSRNGSRRSSRQNQPSSPYNVSFSSPSPLGFSPRANSSRSSLDSAGSSFHSWDEPDKVLNIFSDSKDPAPWHEFSDQKGKTENSESEEDEPWDAEDIVQRSTGLKKCDFVVVQDKLVAAEHTKLANLDPRDRAPSSLRRRRPSTSQSNYNRVNSPPPQQQSSAVPLAYAEDQLINASALLNSVVNSIQEQPNATLPLSDEKEISPNTLPNRDLAHVLFGAEDEKKEESVEKESKHEVELVSTNTVPVIQQTSSQPTIVYSPSQDKENTHARLPSDSSQLLPLRPLTPRTLQTPEEQAELAREVQQKTEAAMLALHKNSSGTNLGDGLKHSSSIRRRVDPSQISTPTLVSTTTSVETIPIRSPSITSNNNPTSIGSRFKKLRGSLRTPKNIVSSGEETVTPESVKSPPTSQFAYYDPSKLGPGAPKLSSATEGRFKVPVPSPPASAGPGLKGFMARFRNKQRMSEIPSGEEQRPPPRLAPPLSPTSPLIPKQADQAAQRPHTSPPDKNNLTRPTGQRPMYSRFPPANPPTPTTHVAPPPTEPAEPQAPPAQAQTLDASQSAAALEQLFKAANNLGLDENALNEFLVKSRSTSSRNLLSRNTSATPTVSTLRPVWKDSDNVQPVSYVGSTGSDQTTTPATYASSSGIEQQQSKADLSEIRPVTPEESISRKQLTRKADQLRRPKEGQSEQNTIVRRTIFYANDSVSVADLSSLIQRKNSARRKRASGTSVSSRSVHDRAPTPPPPKTPTGKRFSADSLPPMPQMPNFLGSAEKMLNAPSTSASGPIEKSNSQYDSLYDMYAGESRATSVLATDVNTPTRQQNPRSEPTAASEPPPAVELIQLANGEMIWNIVNGLRDADEESIYSRRTSFASEYSTRESGIEGVQAITKDYTRSGSRGSTHSFASKKKAQQGKTRPETKVFYSTSAQIGRLIENLSQAAEAGSFNFSPNVPSRGPGHSASSSLSTNDINWTVEERLDHMLGAINNS